MRPRDTTCSNKVRRLFEAAPLEPLHLPIPSCPAQSGANPVPNFPLEMIARRAGDKRANVAEQQPVEAYAVPLGKLDNTLAASFRRAISPRPIEKAAIRLKS